jgi:DNA-binding Lrp family transcriptional regulator
MPHKFTEAIFHAKLPLVDKTILWVLSEHANADDVAWPGQSRIAAFAGCDYTTVARALKRLQTLGVITHIGWHESPRGPVKKFALNMKRILAVGTVGEAPTVGGEGTVGGAPDKPINSQLRVGDSPMTETESRHTGGSGVSPDDLAAVRSSAIAIADVAASLRSEKTKEQHQEQQQHQEQLPNTRDSVPNPAGDLGPGPSGMEESANAEDPASPSPFSRQGDPARWLANCLWMYVWARPDVEIPYSWERYWSLDFQEALDRGWELEQLEAIIQASQYGAARQYYVRAKSICDEENLKRLEKIAEYLRTKDLLGPVTCRKCNAFFPDISTMVGHFFVAHPRPVDPDDVAEEEAMDLADELVSEGYVPEHPDLRMFYPWGDDDDDKDMFDPWADVPEQLPEADR